MTPLRNSTDIIPPGNITTIPVKINILYVLERSKGAKIEFKMASFKNPSAETDPLDIDISSGIPQSLVEFNDLYLSVIILSSFLIFVMKLK